ncbi:MAG: amidophosphoribosyltransferase [Flavobacteriaceae bacterium]|nr:amidophosphoribosyltransferase [Flavobacteriaceae bacterium]
MCDFFYQPKKIVLHFIHLLKYKNQPEIGSFFAQLWLEKYPKNQWPKIDLIIPVPLHPKKQQKRGYNQLDLFGKSLANTLDAIYCTDVLKQSRFELSQTKKNVRARFESKKMSYQLENPEIIKAKSILLIDDVISTGATIISCLNQLKKGAPNSIKIAAIAYTPKMNQFI